MNTAPHWADRCVAVAKAHDHTVVAPTTHTLAARRVTLWERVVAFFTRGN